MPSEIIEFVPPKGLKAWFWEPRPGKDNVPLYLFFKNRWFRITIFFLWCFCCSEIHQGWQQLSRMLYRDGAYRWYCTPEEILTTGTYDYCTKQYNTVSNLLTIGQSCEYVFGVVAGLFLDHVGPWPTGAIGVFMHLIGIFLLIMSSHSFNAYIPAMIFITGSINMVCFPMLCLADLFPTWRGLVISLVSCSQIVSTMMAPIWKAIWDHNPNYTFRGILGTYGLVISLPLGILYLLSMPWSKLNQLNKYHESSLYEEDGLVSREGSKNDSRDNDKEISRDGVINSREALAGDDAGAAGATAAKEALPNTTPSTVICIKEPEQNKSWIEENGRLRRKTYNFWQQFTSPDYILFTIWYVIQVMMFGYFPTFVLDYAGKDVSDYLGYLSPSQGLFGLLFGLSVDYTKTIPLTLGINGGIVAAYLLALIKKKGVQYLSSTLYIIANSYIYASKYIFVAERFSPKHWGTLMGFIGCIAGFINLCNIAIEHSNTYTGICLGYAVAGAADLLILLWHLRRSHQKINYLDL